MASIGTHVRLLFNDIGFMSQKHLTCQVKTLIPKIYQQLLLLRLCD